MQINIDTGFIYYKNACMIYQQNSYDIKTNQRQLMLANSMRPYCMEEFKVIVEFWYRGRELHKIFFL